MGRSKAGRKAKPGARYKCGKLRPVHDRGNERTASRAARFRPFQGGKAEVWVRESAIGRAWAVGLLDGFDADAAAIRDAGLGYAARYWSYYPSASGVSNYEAEDRRGRSWGVSEDPRGEIFRKIDKAVRDAGRASYQAVQAMVVDTYWFPDLDPPWLERLINARLAVEGQDVSGALPLPGDHDTLRLAVEGLLTMVDGRGRNRRTIR